MSVSIFATLKAASEKDDQQYLQDIEADLKKGIDNAPKQNIDDLFSSVNNTSFFHAQNFGAESYPKACFWVRFRSKTKKLCTALR